MISSMYMLPAEHSPCVILLDSEGSKGQQEAYVLHLFPNTATQAARARMLSPLLSALTGVTLKLTGQQVRCVTFPLPLPGFKAAYAPSKGRKHLVCCWPIDMPDATAARLAEFVSELLVSILGPSSDWFQGNVPGKSQEICLHSSKPDVAAPNSKASTLDLIHSCLLPEAQHQFDFLVESVLQQLRGTGWEPLAKQMLIPAGVPATHQQDRHELENMLTHLEVGAAALQPSTFVEQPQASLLFRGAVTASHMHPQAMHSAWAYCWAMSVLQRTPSHPPLVMLQDLQVPKQPPNSKASAAMLTSTAGTVCMSLLLVADGENLLCLGLWPSADASGQDLAESSVPGLATSYLQQIVKRDADLTRPGMAASISTKADARIVPFSGSPVAQPAGALRGKHQGIRLSCVPATGQVTLATDQGGMHAQKPKHLQQFSTMACWIHDCLTSMRHMMPLSTEAELPYATSPVSSLDTSAFASKAGSDTKLQSGASQSSAQTVNTTTFGHPACNDLSQPGLLGLGSKLTLHCRHRLTQPHAAPAGVHIVKARINDNAFVCASEVLE